MVRNGPCRPACIYSTQTLRSDPTHTPNQHMYTPHEEKQLARSQEGSGRKKQVLLHLLVKPFISVGTSLYKALNLCLSLDHLTHPLPKQDSMSQNFRKKKHISTPKPKSRHAPPKKSHPPNKKRKNTSPKTGSQASFLLLSYGWRCTSQMLTTWLLLRWLKQRVWEDGRIGP